MSISSEQKYVRMIPQVGTLQCTIPYDSRNEHSVSYDMDSWGPANLKIPSYTIYILTGASL